MAYNTPWNEQEERDTALGWQAFHERYPERTYQAWRVRRLEVSKRQTALTAEQPKPKPIAAPVPEGMSDAELFDTVLTYTSKLWSK